MILPDVNLLIYAHNLRAPQHQKALDWWNRYLAANPVSGPLTEWSGIQIALEQFPYVFRFARLERLRGPIQGIPLLDR